MYFRSATHLVSHTVIQIIVLKGYSYVQRIGSIDGMNCRLSCANKVFSKTLRPCMTGGGYIHVYK